MFIGAGELAKKYNEVMQKIAMEINEEYKAEGTFGVVYQPGLTGFKNSSSPYGQGYLSAFDWYVALIHQFSLSQRHFTSNFLYFMLSLSHTHTLIASIQTSAPTRSWQLRCGMYVIV